MTKSCNFMIFGATGDLTYLKLIPAIYGLFKEGQLCDTFKLVCIGRRELSLNTYLEPLDSTIRNQLEFFEFKKHIIYRKVDFTVEDNYLDLDYKFGNWIYYLATAPRFFEDITSHLKTNHFLEEVNGFRRIVFEKPFGENFSDAKHINKHISKLLNEDQIFRIDHYLGKEMIQNILYTRVYNSFFEMLWHKDAIEKVEVVISEAIGVKNRGGYYDNSGALKDMVQNHMFQIVALIGMDLPEILIPEAIRNEKAKVLKNINLTDDLVLGQYIGYRGEKDIAPNSNTETFVAMKLLIDNKRWKGVPFYIKTGKSLIAKHAHVVVHFKKNKGSADNVLMIEIQPKEGIYLQVNSKAPGISNDIKTVKMDYCHSCLKYGDEPSAYGRLLLDIIIGDKSLFASWEEIEISWSIIDKIDKDKIELISYHPQTNWDKAILLREGWWRYD